jgi:NADPH:quinone reductase
MRPEASPYAVRAYGGDAPADHNTPLHVSPARRVNLEVEGWLHLRYRCALNHTDIEDTMKAYALTVPNQPAALADLPGPEARVDGALVRVRAASVNGIDVYQASGALAAMMPHDLPTVVGRDFAGVVEAVGDARTDVTIGDEVIGFIPSTPPLHVGSWAELVPAGPDVPLARKPAGISFDAAAAIPLAGVAALDAVHAAEIKDGDTVVVVGATGGVGSFAIQFAVQRGATVIATAKAGDEDAFVRSLGATETIDYATGDVVEALQSRFPDGFDVLIDLVNRGDAFTPIASLVRDGGRIATTMGTADVDALAARDVRATNVMATPTPDKLAWVVEHVAGGSVRVEVQETFPLADAAAATAAFAAGTIGKLVLKVG